MPADVIRVLSDLHFGDRSSRVARMGSLAPLAEGADSLILNGDTMDTRPGPDPAHTARCRAEVADFFAGLRVPSQFVTGNHDPDISDRHWLDLAGGRAWVIHGDIFFEQMVPWSADGPAIGRRLRGAFEAAGWTEGGAPLAERMAVYRTVARSVRQRHQSERRRGRHFARLLRDVFWPPWRAPRLFEAWRTMPERTRHFAGRYRPDARVVLVGHTHRTGIWRASGGITVVNTGSFTFPFGPWAADFGPSAIVLRAIRWRQGAFRIGEKVAEIPF